MKSICSILLSATLLFSSSCSQQNTSSSSRTLRINYEEDIPVLDPRMARDLPSVTPIHALYEGLMRSQQGKLEPALVEKIDISPDQKMYTFTLKNTFWSNGDPLTAEDFVQTWKTVLNPAFPAPNAYQLYIIKGAKSAKEGSISLDKIGISAPDAKTLIVELETPTPHFLEMTSCHFFYPVHAQLREGKKEHSRILIGNGPFKLDSWKDHSELILVKNLSYWNSPSVKMDGIVFIKLEPNTALQLYESGGLDWTGSPISTIPQDAVSTLRKRGQLAVSPGAGTHWLRINTESYPLNNVDLRKALAYALDRQAIVDHVTQGNQIPATGIIPPSLSGWEKKQYFKDNDPASARIFLQKALGQMGLTLESLPQITLSYAKDERNHKIAQAVQQQWQTALGIAVNLESNEKQVQFNHLTNGNYQVSTGSWFADYKDPINFLEIFKSKNNPTNNTRWENEHYRNILDSSTVELDEKTRQAQFQQAEKMLINEMPVIPLFFSTFNYVKSDKLQNVGFSELGYLDFANTFFKD